MQTGTKLKNFFIEGDSPNNEKFHRFEREMDVPSININPVSIRHHRVVFTQFRVDFRIFSLDVLGNH